MGRPGGSDAEMGDCEWGSEREKGDSSVSSSSSAADDSSEVVSGLHPPLTLSSALSSWLPDTSRDEGGEPGGVRSPDELRSLPLEDRSDSSERCANSGEPEEDSAPSSSRSPNVRVMAERGEELVNERGEARPKALECSDCRLWNVIRSGGRRGKGL